MSDDFNEFLNGNESGQSDGGQLRKFAEAQKKRADELEKQLKEFQDKLAAQSLKSVFDDLKVPEKVRKFYTGDPDSEAVKKWFEENADVFNLTPVTEQQTETQAEQSQLERAERLGTDLTGGDLSLANFETAAKELKSRRQNPAALEDLFTQFLGKGGYNVNA